MKDLLKLAAIKVRVDSESGIIGKLEELRKSGYTFQYVHCRGGDLYDLKVSFDTQKAKPILEIPGVILARVDT